MQRLIRVDSKVRTDPGFPAGFMGTFTPSYLSIRMGKNLAPPRTPPSSKGTDPVFSNFTPRSPERFRFIQLLFEHFTNSCSGCLDALSFAGAIRTFFFLRSTYVRSFLVVQMLSRLSAPTSTSVCSMIPRVVSPSTVSPLRRLPTSLPRSRRLPSAPRVSPS
jgi:hypothetical protein